MQNALDTQTLPGAALPPTSGAAAARLGIIGGGQLARMTGMVALQLGCEVTILERSPASPAATLATHSLVGDWNEDDILRQLAESADVITLENEFVDARRLQFLEELGCTVLPGARTIALVQDKFVQKQTLLEAGLPVPAPCAVGTEANVADAGAELGWPLLLKARRNGYDGKGNATVRSAGDIHAAWLRLGGDRGNELFVEQFCPFTHELATIITRGRRGELATYPVVETVQRDHICHLVRAPAPLPSAVVERAAAIARRAVEAVEAVGSFGVEMFLTGSGEILVNELAPRVHNSGHYTIEACLCSQFENHVRAVLGWPLGSTAMVSPAAVMVNLLGVGAGAGQSVGIEQALAVPAAHVHVYGKARSGAGRKMGHVTALGEDLAAAEATASCAAAAIRFGAVENKK